LSLKQYSISAVKAITYVIPPHKNEIVLLSILKETWGLLFYKI